MNDIEKFNQTIADLESGKFSNGFDPIIEKGFAIAGEYKSIPVLLLILYFPKLKKQILF